MRFSIAGVCLAAAVASGCAGNGLMWRECAGRSLRAASPSGHVAAELAAAGGGRPQTGYAGVAAALYFASNRDLSGGWGVDLNYVQNLSRRSSVELALGTVGYEVKAAGESGSLRAVTFGAVAQYGRPFGTSRWYAGAGGAWWLNETSGLGDRDADDALALILAGGVEFQLSMRLNLDLEFRYTFAESRLNGDDLDLGAFAARVNCVLLF